MTWLCYFGNVLYKSKLPNRRSPRNGMHQKRKAKSTAETMKYYIQARTMIVFRNGLMPEPRQKKLIVIEDMQQLLHISKSGYTPTNLFSEFNTTERKGNSLLNTVAVDSSPSSSGI
jgi:hypothetical protein